MIYLFFFYLPEVILKFFTELIKQSNADFQLSTGMTVTFHALIGIITATISVIIVYLAFRLLRAIWHKFKFNRMGKYLEKELLPIFKNIDWWVCLVVVICSEILIEYWQIFLPITRKISFVREVFYFFSPDGDFSNSVRSFASMMVYYGVSFVFFYIIPLMLLVGRHIKTGDNYYVKYTFGLGKWKPGLILTLACWLFMLIVLYIAMGLDLNLRSIYPMGGNKAIMNNAGLFIIYEIGAFIYLISFEFFFRGILFFEFERKIGNYAILIMILPYIIIKFGKPSIEIISAIIAGLAFGIMSKWTKTFLYGALLHFLVACSADIIATLYREGILVFSF